MSTFCSSVPPFCSPTPNNTHFSDKVKEHIPTQSRLDIVNYLGLYFVGPPEYLPVDEKHPVGKGLTNPYGKTKFFIEEIFRDLAKAEKGWRVVLLRYFNPVGSHPSGLIGEDPQGPPNNLMPYVSQVRSHSF